MFKMYDKRIQKRRPALLLFSFVIILIVFDSNLMSVGAAKKSKSGMIKSGKNIQISKEQQKDAEAVYNVSYVTPFRYHYSPWITKKLLLTMNITSTNIQYYSSEKMNSVTAESQAYDYECNDPSVIRNKPQIYNLSSINSEDFKDDKDLTCYEKSFLQELVRMLKNKKIKNHWSNCDVLNKNTITDICKKAEETAEKLTSKDINEKAAHEELKNILNGYSLKYCSKFVLKDVVSKVNRQRLLNQQTFNGTCDGILTELVQLDALVNFFSCEFDEILSRIYCQGYSVKETCDECSVAYKQWLCSVTLPYYFDDLLIKPCLSICQRVERTCPYLHPEMKDQYGGEPIFICNDPDIPILKNSRDEPYGKDRSCYQKCHLEANHTLTMKSLLIKNETKNSKQEEPQPAVKDEEENEDALIENPDFEICIPRNNIIQNRKKQNKNAYEDNESKDQRQKLENQTKSEKSNQSKRDLFAKWSIEDGYNSARMVDQIELEEEEIVEEVNKETIAALEHEKHQLDDIYYLDNNNSLTTEEANNQTNSSANDDQQFKLNKQTFTTDQQSIKDQKFHLNQHQETNFNHFSEDDENDNEDGDSDLDQVISTTTITSLNYQISDKQTNHLDKKQ